MTGLTAAEVQQRTADGRINGHSAMTSRTYWDIIRENVFTFIHLILFTITGVLIAVGRYSDAVIYIVVVLFNVTLSVVQEIKAKRTLDAIVLVTRPQTTVIRDGVPTVIAQSDVVQDDIIKLVAGDQVVVDAEVIQGSAAVDESMLTGESRPIQKTVTESLLSGSFVTRGVVYAQAIKVRDASYIQQITQQAKRFKKNVTPLQKEINLGTRILIVLMFVFGATVWVQQMLMQMPIASSIQIMAVIGGLIPNALFAMITLAYAMGAARIASHKALVQELNAVESLSNVDTLCVDKTGTLTTNQLAFHSVRQYGDTSMASLAATFFDFSTDENQTAQVLRQWTRSTLTISDKYTLCDELPFSSANKYAMISVKNIRTNKHYVLVLGAPDTVGSVFADADKQQVTTDTHQLSQQGLRSVVFAVSQPLSSTQCKSIITSEKLPAVLQPIHTYAIADEIRADARATLSHFQSLGVDIRVISGDNPSTVQALVKQLGIDIDDTELVTGTELSQAQADKRHKLISHAKIFGRIQPDQKESIVAELQKNGKYVAMIGDGVNDILSIKKADVGVAMQHGSSAARAVADIILLDNSFASLPLGFEEGQRIVSGLHATTKIFVTRVLNISLILLSTQLLGFPFPLSITQSSLIALITSGIPTFGLTLWAQPQSALTSGSLVSSLFQFAFPAAIVTTIYSLIVYGISIFARGQQIVFSQFPLDADQFVQAQNANVLFLCLAGISLLALTYPPIRQLQFHPYTHLDWRPTVLAVILTLVTLSIFIFPPLQAFWGIQAFSWSHVGLVAVCYIAWLVTLLITWKYRMLNRFLARH